jgi:hypothetical protein
VNVHSGILTGNPQFDPVETVTLATTPGIPLEWIYAVLKLGRRRKDKLRELIRAADRVLGKTNATTITLEDGHQMLLATPSTYNGAVPLYVQLWLQQTIRSDQSIADELGTNRQKIQRWRTNHVFDPLTGQRLIPAKGVPAR